MEASPFVPALLELRKSDIDTVIERLGKVFTHISQMGPQEVMAAYNTITTTAEFCGMKEDLAITTVLRALHRQMVLLASQEDPKYCEGGLSKAFSFCLNIHPINFRDID